MSTESHDYTKPSDQYNRLLTAFNLEQVPNNSRTYFTTLVDLLSIKKSMLSDCIRRGDVTAPVLQAAKASGVNPDYITKGILPICLNSPDSK